MNCMLALFFACRVTELIIEGDFNLALGMKFAESAAQMYCIYGSDIAGLYCNIVILST